MPSVIDIDQIIFLLASAQQADGGVINRQLKEEFLPQVQHPVQEGFYGGAVTDHHIRAFRVPHKDLLL